MGGSNRSRDGIDYAALYDQHAAYSARRVDGSFEQRLILLEALEFKIPSLLSVCPGLPGFASVLEIGCATGEIIANVPIRLGGRRVGCDISSENVARARARFPDVEFFAGDFRTTDLGGFDCVILSDILEHVEDDVGFLRCASALGRFTLLNLPLEDNWLNRTRPYGPTDPSGHLRSYSLKSGLDLVRDAGLDVHCIQQVWVHETSLEQKRRSLRQEMTGRRFSGPAPLGIVKSMVLRSATALRPIGRRLFASNLFALLAPRTA